jgi:prepilin-type N-terminal cleavage/methylation domain-containing protein
MINILSAIKSIKNNSSGFTMIELLVVIAVIGVLAVAVLSSINPIEQINKGRDTRTRSDAAQLINAVDRFFAIHEVYPWNLDSDPDSNLGSDYTFTATVLDYQDLYEQSPEQAGGAEWGWLGRLVSTAEVKQGFTNRLINDDTLYIHKAAGSNTTMYVCFEPTSQAFKLEAQKKCDNDTTPSDLEILGRNACDPDGENLICLP